MQNYQQLPPMTMVLAEYDPLIDEAKQYVASIENNGGEVTVLEVKGAVHTFDFFDCKLTDDFTKYKIAYFKQLHLK